MYISISHLMMSSREYMKPIRTALEELVTNWNTNLDEANLFAFLAYSFKVENSPTNYGMKHRISISSPNPDNLPDARNFDIGDICFRRESESYVQADEYLIRIEESAYCAAKRNVDVVWKKVFKIVSAMEAKVLASPLLENKRKAPGCGHFVSVKLDYFKNFLEKSDSGLFLPRLPNRLNVYFTGMPSSSDISKLFKPSGLPKSFTDYRP